MKNSLIISSLIILFAAVLSGCTGKSKRNGAPQNPHRMAKMADLSPSSSDFAAHLSAKNEVPPVDDSTASGVVYFKMNDDSTQIYYTLQVHHLKNVTRARLHYGANSYNGPHVMWLYPDTYMKKDTLIKGYSSGTLKSSMINKAALRGGALDKKDVKGLIQAMKHDSIYVQVCTKYHPTGVIRGQVKPMR